jgi:hypothetical protein
VHAPRSAAMFQLSNARPLPYFVAARGLQQACNRPSTAPDLLRRLGIPEVQRIVKDHSSYLSGRVCSAGCRRVNSRPVVVGVWVLSQTNHLQIYTEQSGTLTCFKT